MLTIVALACASDRSPFTEPPTARVVTPRKTVKRPALRPTATQPVAKSVVAATQSTQPTTQPVPLLTADETIKTFKLPPGFRIEVVAEEPLVQHPVAMAFAPDGRIWVVEMRSYMTPDVDAAGERRPLGRVSVLEDVDGDGRMDKSTIFWDGLVLPRAIGLARDGAFVAVPPNLWFCRDTNNDGKSDERRSIAQDYGIRGNPEHQPNGLMYGLDNWVYSANYNFRLRFIEKKWALDEVVDAGQWGISQDDSGRIFINSNSSYLRGNLVAPHYLLRNPHFRPGGVNVDFDPDQTTWPAHATAVNRGYREGVLRPENQRLWKFTGACGPVVYRGGLFPEEYDGNVFVGEVTANFVRRSVLAESGGKIIGDNAYEKEKDEFLTSTYERFRPVNLYTGPEGALYVVDMHHGLIQHKQYVTPYLREQYAVREMGKYIGNTGRIYRIVPDNGPTPKGPNLATATNLELVGHLSHRNGWVRDTAQRLLVERRDPATVEPLRALAMEGEAPLGRLHALWTLEGIEKRDADVLLAALADLAGKNRAAAIRLSEPFMADDVRVREAVLKLAADGDPDVRLQFALSVSAAPTPEAELALVEVVTAAADNQYVRDAAISGLKGREFEFLQLLIRDPRWAQKGPGRDAMLAALTKCVVAEADPQRVMGLTDLIARETSPQLAWRQLAMVDSFPPIDPKKPVRKPVKLTTRPSSLDVLAASEQANIRERTPRVMNVLTWPGKRTNTTTRKTLSDVEQERFEAGRITYASVCGQCHKPDGMGQAGLAPSLVDSEWVLGSQERLIKIVLHGLRGPVDVNGQTWELDMPHLRTLSDLEIANALTYVRREWEHDGDPVQPADVAKLRAKYEDRQEAWTVRELSGANTNN
ncbi:MAG: PVC-type heme-binding CxxCH protein [Tepidisphaeraceae bacterium]